MIKNITKVTFLLLAILAVQSCTDSQQNKLHEEHFKGLQIDKIPAGVHYNDTTYVPIYSEIYIKTKNIRFNLTATLSLRNTSLKHTIYVSEVDYYNSFGEKTKSFLTKPIALKPLQTAEYVIDESDTSGGAGANFIVNWGSKSDVVKPIFQGVMISTQGQQGVSFTTKGVSISNR
ncbi:DUF3124 domain-containing protein [Aurantibacter sp.]|uniref:DUF3124 domain-containing protein n=1 Tax=Aurantibacter sp. TaxID=2807103 RepID=UPI0032630C30